MKEGVLRVWRHPPASRTPAAELLLRYYMSWNCEGRGVRFKLPWKGELRQATLILLPLIRSSGGMIRGHEKGVIEGGWVLTARS